MNVDFTNIIFGCVQISNSLQYHETKMDEFLHSIRTTSGSMEFTEFILSQ